MMMGNIRLKEEKKNHLTFSYQQAEEPCTDLASITGQAKYREN